MLWGFWVIHLFLNPINLSIKFCVCVCVCVCVCFVLVFFFYQLLKEFLSFRYALKTLTGMSHITKWGGPFDICFPKHDKTWLILLSWAEILFSLTRKHIWSLHKIWCQVLPEKENDYILHYLLLSVALKINVPRRRGYEIKAHRHIKGLGGSKCRLGFRNDFIHLVAFWKNSGCQGNEPICINIKH